MLKRQFTISRHQKGKLMQVWKTINVSLKDKSWINACSSLSRQEFELKFQKSWKTFERMWVRTLKIEVLFTFTISPMFEKFTRNQVSHLKCPDLSRSRQCFFPIASRLFYDGVDDDDDDDNDGDDVTSGSGHSLESCFCVYQNSYCDCAVDDQFLKVLRCPGVGTFLHPEEKLVCPLVHCLRFLRLEKSVHRYFWREIVDVLCYFHILCLMQWVHNFVAPKFHDLLFIRS